MSAQGLKHGTEPVPVDAKREYHQEPGDRRRGAAGRAAALRRAPSDSDCSGETASLSADSGDRRPPPPPPRSGKTRSRRRGSEWEVLEGLKDGQRFERRPEVFNGYLHKKRKWPLKGWHKRFFVVDGGILVYARSPTDVARGRLHGSLDVGLSVISAKPRRRRIDIDADEFIYHLRAKTPEVFRTWLNVLKAHRLYRQHLLTFGARESVPKIHAPLEDLPPTDTSSHISRSSVESFSTLTTSKSNTEPKLKTSPTFHFPSSNIVSSVYAKKSGKFLQDWNVKISSSLLPLKFEPVNVDDMSKNLVNQIKPGSLCSMCCVEKRIQNNDALSQNVKSVPLKNDENIIESTNLDLTVLKTMDPNVHSSVLENFKSCDAHSVLLGEYSLNPSSKNSPVNAKTFNNPLDSLHTYCEETKPSLFGEKNETAMYLFPHKNRHYEAMEAPVIMKRSRKSTNLCKYRNCIEEPVLKRPLSKCMLLAKYKLNSGDTKNVKMKNISVICDILPQGDSLERTLARNKTVQDTKTSSECDKITENLLITLFDSPQSESLDGVNQRSSDIVKMHLKHVVRDLYNVNATQRENQPVKYLFKSLLEYWLNNTRNETFRHTLRESKALATQSNEFFTQDKQLSSDIIKNSTKATQVFAKIADVSNLESKNITPKLKLSKNKKPTLKDIISPKRDTESFEKERRIQELERLLKNTVYICDTVNSTKSKEKDIKITKTLIDNLEKLSKKSTLQKVSDEKHDISDSSNELPKMQETINRLISETKLPPEVAKEFLNVYLDMLLNNNSKSNTSTSQSSDASKIYKSNGDTLPIGDVQTESVVRKISKSVTVIPLVKSNRPSFDGDDQSKNPNVDPGQLYLKDMLDKITYVFSRNGPVLSKLKQESKKVEELKRVDDKESRVKENLHNSTNCPTKGIIYENKEDKSVVIDLSKYDLEHIELVNDTAPSGMVSITIKLKERPSDVKEEKRRNLSFKFSNDQPKLIDMNTPVQKSAHVTTNTPKQIKSRFNTFLNMRNPCIDFNARLPAEKLEPKQFLSTTDATSKANCRIFQKSDHSFDLSMPSSDIFLHYSASKRSNNDDAQCYLLSSFKKGTVEETTHLNRKVRLQGINDTLKSRVYPLESTRKNPEGFQVFESKPPRIIDEKFILLLLENLTLLSKNLPGIHKDINNLYLKLKKKHEKTIKNTNLATGLSLLGKIYDDGCLQNPPRLMFDGETQFDDKIFPVNRQSLKEAVQIAVNTSLFLPNASNVTNKSLSTRELVKTLANLQVQTECLFKTKEENNRSKHGMFKKKCTEIQEPSVNNNEYISSNDLLNTDVSMETRTFFPSSMFIDVETLKTADRSVSIQNWYKKLTQDRSVCTIVKCLLDRKDTLTRNFQMASPKPTLIIPSHTTIAPKKSQRKQSDKIRQDLIKEIRLLSPSFKVSTQSQTDTKSINPEARPKRDYKVYQLFPKNNVTRSESDSSVATEFKEKSDDLNTIYRCTSDPSFLSGLISPTAPPIRGPQAGFVSGTPGGRLASWIIESGGPLESASRELGQAQLSVQQLQRLLDALELQQLHHDTDVSLEGASPNVKKDRRKFGLRKKKSNSKCASVELAPPHVDPSSSHMALSALTAPPSPGGGASSMPNSAASLPIACAAARPQSLPGAEALNAGGPTSLTSLTPDHQLREDFTVLAKDLVASLKTIVSTMVCERGRLRAAMDAAETTLTPGGAVVAALRTNLTSALQQNSVLNIELRSRLSRIHDASDLAEISSVGNNSDQVTRQFPQSLSYSSSCVSASEFFDAEEHDDDLKPAEIIATDAAGVIELDGDSSSEAGSLSSEEGEASSDNSDGATSAVIPAARTPLQNGSEQLSRFNQSVTSRRARLPCPRPTPASPSLWNLLYKNIGKDLSQISMPVTINEPLNMLQRLCEELEYSELLDAAADCTSDIERMALVAAFAVSAYAASAHRAASKPFNPLLGETYECVRPDREFRFLAEQVSHHPPISACHAESPRWTFWQEARIKTKFWGKSMEFQPTGHVHVRLHTTGDHYSWNKVTTCVHNLFGGQRWVDQYGDMHITCHGTDITCKLNFIKASSWSSSRHEVRGTVLSNGVTRLRLQGRWSEGLQAGERMLWRPGAMPPDYELYYGFTRFAMELNELEPGMRDVLPNTDTRLRPDQRSLEQGDVDAAEQFKHELEQAQRERRRDGNEHKALWFRKTVEEGEETWVFTGEYWKAREAGFSETPRLW